MTHEEAIKPLDSAIWEMSEVFDGLKDDDVWVRAHPRLLSIGELAAHVAFGEIKHLHKDFSSPFASDENAYYLYSVEKTLVLAMTAQEVYEEVKRVHEACKEKFLTDRPDLSGKNPYRDEWDWSCTMEYMGFHIAYHTGQMYSVRHLMGHETNNN